MIVFKLALVLLPFAQGVPAAKRQASVPVSNDTSSPLTAKVILGGPDHPTEVIGTVNTDLNLDQYFNIPFAKARKSQVPRYQRGT